MNADVLIVGAGPTGLMLACWLKRSGRDPLVIDKKAGLTQETRALAVQARTLETYDMLGIVERALAEGIPALGLNMQVHQHRVGYIELGKIGKEISPYPYMFVLGQDKNERILLEHYLELGGRVQWETSLATLRQDEEGVDADLCTSTGHLETARFRYVCGCDGANSKVRQELGLDFTGGTYTHRYFVADVLGKTRQVERRVSVWLDSNNFLAFFPMPGEDHYRIVGIVPSEVEDRRDLTFEDVAPRVAHYSDMRVSQTFWFSTYNVHHRVASAFRTGRVFLLGDAGHVHSPVGGQGMNTGLMDATNLGWKLAAVLNGETDQRLLASYERERIPFAHQLVKTTDQAFSFATASSLKTWLQRTVMMQAVFPILTRFSAVRRALFGLVSQTRVNYHDSPINQGKAGKVQAGDRLPWVPLSTGGSNYDELRALQLQIQVYGEPSPAEETFARQHPEFPLKKLPWTPVAARAGLQKDAFYFLRPDGYVAYATPDFSEEAFLAFLRDAWGWQGAQAKVTSEVARG